MIQYLIYMAPFLLLSFYAQHLVKSNYRKYKKIKNNLNMSGAEIAQKMLTENSVNDVSINVVAGELTDHFHPTKKVVNLSEDVYYGRSISALSIAAHEVGHVLQHQTNYTPINVRSLIFPVASFGSKSGMPMFIIGLFVGIPFLMDLGIILFAGALIFHLVTLPVEFNASKRAISYISQNITSNNKEIKYYRKVLNAAALTYVASTLMALAQLIRLLGLRGSRN